MILEFTSDVDPGYKDAYHIQNDLLYICPYTDFGPSKTNLLDSCLL